MPDPDWISGIIPQTGEVNLQPVLTLVIEDIVSAVWQVAVSEQPALQKLINAPLLKGAPHRVVETGPYASWRIVGCDVFLSQRLYGGITLGRHRALAAWTLEMPDAQSERDSGLPAVGP